MPIAADLHHVDAMPGGPSDALLKPIVVSHPDLPPPPPARTPCGQIGLEEKIETRRSPQVIASFEENGAGRESRTPDLLITNQLLYH